MCPGIAVLGGGGGAGGSSGKGSKKGKGKKKGKTSKKNKKAKGGKKNGKCGKGKKGGKCATHDASKSAGHPVDVVTGRAYTDPVTDFRLPGPLWLEFERSYSTAFRERDCGLGFGWSHSFAWELEVHRRYIVLRTPDGRELEFPTLPIAESVLGPDGFVLRRESWGYLLDDNEENWLAFGQIGASNVYRLTAIQDKNQNRISVAHDNGALVEIVDSVGRVVRVVRDSSGRIGGFETRNSRRGPGRWIRLVSYEYDGKGDLIAVTDADGDVTRFAYDRHLLTQEREPTGLTWHFIYDHSDRCIETWGDYPGRQDPALSARLPMLLADGVTRLKGVRHVRITFFDDDTSEVADPYTVARYFGNPDGTISKAVEGAVSTRTFDEFGNVASLTDPTGGESFFEHDPRGRLLKRVDARGRTLQITRDAHGRPIEITDPRGGVTKAWYDARGNLEGSSDPAGGVITYRSDERGQLVEHIDARGARTEYSYDDDGNLVSMVQPNGGRWSWEYDELGNVLSQKDAAGNTRRFVLSASGNLIAEYDAEGGVCRYSYDGAGNLVEFIDQDGNVEKYEYGGYHDVYRIVHADGTELSLRYDTESRLLDAINENGEPYTCDRDVLGHLASEVSFDGIRRSFRFDPLGRMTRLDDGAGGHSEFIYDEAGQLAECVYDDGTSETFEYDLLGNISRIVGPEAEVRFERNVLGAVIAEHQTVAGSTVALHYEYDAAGDLIRRTSTLGLDQHIQRDSLGSAARLILDKTHALTFQRNIFGQEIERLLPAGGVIDSEYTANGWLSRRRAIAPQRATPGAKDQPSWVGKRRDGTVSEHAYRYSGTGEVLERWDALRGITTTTYDPRRRVLERLPPSGAGERYSYDRAGNPLPRSGQSRSYAAGNILTGEGNRRYRYDGDGRLVQKTEQLEDGTERSWEYKWNAQGLLATVMTPAGERVEFGYDPFARRVQKRVVSISDDGEETLVRDVRYVWDADVIAHVIEDRGAAEQFVRTYCYDDDTMVPLAHRDGAADASSSWIHYLNDLTGAPECLVADDGEVVAKVERSARGAFSFDGSATTDLRLLGQIADEETGLHYNRFRYFDPEIGRFIAQDPVGPAGGLNLYEQDPNTIGWVDPFGLAPFKSPHQATATVFGPKGGNLGSESFDSRFKPGWSAAIKRGEMSSGSARRKCHTEFKALEWARKNHSPLKGKTIKIDGQLPPCSSCRKRMERFAKKHGCTVEYTNPAGQDKNGKPFPAGVHSFP
jgi:RHS repeat-associated protein